MNMKKTAASLAVLAVLFAAAVTRGQVSLPFRFFGPLSRIITPNGDGINDEAFFCFDNPQFSDASGRIFTLLGSEVAALGPARSAAGSSCPAGALPASAEDLVWDGRSNGSVVRSGVYVYRITAEQHTYSGTLIVVR